jgi:hypothetical protein
MNRHLKKRFAWGAAALVAAAAITWLATQRLHSDGDDPVAVTDYRIHELERALRNAPVPPKTLEDIIRGFPADEKDEFRRDGYGRPIQYTLHRDIYELRSLGADGLVGSSDDYVAAGTLSADRR